MPTMSKEYANAYYHKNKERILAKNSGKRYCEYCNKDISKHNFLFHTRTTKHINNVAEKNAPQV